MAKGIQVRYTGDGLNAAPGAVNMFLVPCLWLPFPARNLIPGKDECPTCGIIHPVKTVHLHLDQNGSCLVSEGVLDLLKKAGLELNQLEVVAERNDPPKLQLNGKSRAEINQQNARIHHWNSVVTQGDTNG